MKKLKKFAKSRLSRLEKHMIRFGESGDPEEVHQVRVEIKKIKAVLALLEECVKGFKAHKHFLPFREIFRQAGAIREPEVARQLAARLRIKKRLKASKTQVQSSVRIFDFEIPLYIKRVRKCGKEIVEKAGEVRTKDFEKATHRFMTLIKANVFPEVIVEELHKTRKKLKEILYLSEVSDILSKKQWKFYSSLEQLIGRLHDKQSLLESGTGKAGHKRLSAGINRDEKAIAAMVGKFYRRPK